MDLNMLVTIITSAGIGALVSPLVTMLTQYHERRSRRQELLLSKAIDLAVLKVELIKQACDRSGGKATIRDHASIAADYYHDLQYLLDKGSLRPESLEVEARSKARLANGHNAK